MNVFIKQSVSIYIYIQYLYIYTYPFYIGVRARSWPTSLWNPTYDINRRLHSITISNLFSYTLPKTNSSPLKIGCLSQKERKDRLPSIHFQLMFQGYSNPISSSPSLCQGFKPPPHFCGKTRKSRSAWQLSLCVLHDACQCLVVGW